MHFEVVLEKDISEFVELFVDIANAYFDCRRYQDAYDIYADLNNTESVCGSESLIWKCADN